MTKRKLLYYSLSKLETLTRFFYKDKLRVLAYHKVNNVKSFNDQMVFLKKNYNVITIQDLEAIFKKEKKVVENSVLLTFDDGDISIVENAFPILKRYSLPAVFFIISELIDTCKPFWWDELEYLLGVEIGNNKTWELKNLKNNVRLEYLQDLKNTSPKPLYNSKQLSRDQLNKMADFGYCIGNHSHTHPMFNQCSQDELNYEMSESIQFLRHNNLAPYYFAYPNGNWDKNSEEILKKYNIKLAFLFDHKLSDINNPLRISRIRVDSDLDLPEFKSKVSGLHSILYHKSLS